MAQRGGQDGPKGCDQRGGLNGWGLVRGAESFPSKHCRGQRQTRGATRHSRFVPLPAHHKLFRSSQRAWPGAPGCDAGQSGGAGGCSGSDSGPGQPGDHPGGRGLGGRGPAATFLSVQPIRCAGSAFPQPWAVRRWRARLQASSVGNLPRPLPKAMGAGALPALPCNPFIMNNFRTRFLPAYTPNILDLVKHGLKACL